MTEKRLVEKNKLPKGYVAICAFAYSPVLKKYAVAFEHKNDAMAKCYLVSDFAEIETAPCVQVKGPVAIAFRGADFAVGQRDGIVCYVDEKFCGHEFTNGAHENSTARGFWFEGDFCYVYGAGEQVVRYDLRELGVKKY